MAGVFEALGDQRILLPAGRVAHSRSHQRAGHLKLRGGRAAIRSVRFRSFDAFGMGGRRLRRRDRFLTRIRSDPCQAMSALDRPDTTAKGDRPSPSATLPRPADATLKRGGDADHSDAEGAWRCSSISPRAPAAWSRSTNCSTRVWPGVFVGDAAPEGVHPRDPTRARRRSRTTPRFIETAHRRGYRFIAPVVAASRRRTPASAAAPADPLQHAVAPQTTTRAAATSTSPTRSSATARSISCSSWAGCRTSILLDRAVVRALPAPPGRRSRG